MNLLLFITLILLPAPSLAASAAPGVAAADAAAGAGAIAAADAAAGAGAVVATARAGAVVAASHAAAKSSATAAAQSGDLADEDSAPVSAAELRVLALYGPREFSTFRTSPAGPWTPGETASRGAPLDRHTEDRWLGVDKAKHLAFSFLWTLGTQYVAVNKGRFSEAQALPISVGTSAAVGLSKEYYDLRVGPSHFFSYKDLVADGVGILLAAGVILL